MRPLWILLLAAGCDSATPSTDAPIGTGELGMNDVTMLFPLPADRAAPTVMAMTGDGDDLVPRSLFARLVTMPGDVVDAYETFHIVAVRFDLCDRADPGPCPSALDGRLRIVFQPLFGPPVAANDVALHAFFPIPNAELGEVVGELRALAAMQATPVDAPLAVKGAMTAAYATRLRALILRYAIADRLFRLTLFAQNAMAASLNWAFRGVVRDGATYQDIAIPAISATQQRAILVGADPGYDTMPVADEPSGFAAILKSDTFAAASSTARMQSLEALAAVQNPTMHTAETVQCIACHVSTYLTAHRAGVAGIDPTQLANRFTSTRDLSIAAGMSATNDRALRALGWVGTQPAISQRVANDTVTVLDEIAARY